MNPNGAGRVCGTRISQSDSGLTPLGALGERKAVSPSRKRTPDQHWHAPLMEAS